MIIYNVTVKVDQSISRQWLQWMKGTLIPRVMATGFFSDYRICHLLDQEEDLGITYVIQYMAETMEQYRQYEYHHARPLREASMDLFGTRCVAFRTLMAVID